MKAHDFERLAGAMLRGEHGRPNGALLAELAELFLKRSDQMLRVAERLLDATVTKTVRGDFTRAAQDDAVEMTTQVGAASFDLCLSAAVLRALAERASAGDISGAARG